MRLEKGNIPDDVDDVTRLNWSDILGGKVGDHLHDFFRVVGKGLLLAGEVE